MVIFFLFGKFDIPVLTVEEENDHQLPFLDVCVKRELDGTLSTSVYRKPTYSGLLMKYDSFVPIEFKRSIIYGLVNRAWRICSSETNFQRDVDYLKCLFSANGYPERFVVKCVKTVINRKGLDVVSPVYGPERKPVFISLPYCGTNSLQLKRQLKRILLKKSP